MVATSMLVVQWSQQQWQHGSSSDRAGKKGRGVRGDCGGSSGNMAGLVIVAERKEGGSEERFSFQRKNESHF